jgi:hypothetical protein
MKTFFDILFKKSKPIKNEKFNGLTCNTDDLINGFVEAGFYKYDDCCGVTHLQKKPFTKRQIKNIEEQAKKVLDLHVDEISKAIDKQILKDMNVEVLVPVN